MTKRFLLAFFCLALGLQVWGQNEVGIKERDLNRQAQREAKDYRF